VTENKDTDRDMNGRTIGILGHPWRANVTPAGDIYPLGNESPIRWYVAADDRWHTPADEVAVRQIALSGTPVLETRLRVPGGDVIQRLWVASGRQGSSALMMEFENDSPMAVAVAISHDDLLVSRPVAVRNVSGEWPAPGLELDQVPTVLPVGHRTSVRAALVLSGSSPTINIEDFANHDSVARGWVALSDSASRFNLPDVIESIPAGDVIVAERSELALSPVPNVFTNGEDCARWLISQRELQRMSLSQVDPVDLAGAVEVLARATRRNKISRALALDGFRSALYLLGTDQERAVSDFSKLLAKALSLRGQSLAQMLARKDDGGAHGFLQVTSIENELALLTDENVATLLPNGFPTNRLGVQFEVHDIAVGAQHRVSFAVRWHGPNAAVLWEVVGPAGLILCSGVDPSWSSTQSSGEALWKVENVPTAAIIENQNLSFS